MSLRIKFLIQLKFSIFVNILIIILSTSIFFHMFQIHEVTVSYYKFVELEEIDIYKLIHENYVITGSIFMFLYITGMILQLVIIVHLIYFYFTNSPETVMKNMVFHTFMSTVVVFIFTVWSFFAYFMARLDKQNGYDLEENIWSSEESRLMLNTFYIPGVMLFVQMVIRETAYSPLFKEYSKLISLQNEERKLKNIDFIKVTQMKNELFNDIFREKIQKNEDVEEDKIDDSVLE
uniref:Transmembrane protein n=1 Tax=Strongyloides papillosus TaxID=174720 RepID=A0A0N5CAI7_STREA